MSPRNSELCLLGLVAAAAAVRLWSIGWGLPELGHPDEPLIVARALRILAGGGWNPHWFNYPSLAIYLHVPVLAGVHVITGQLTTLDSRVIDYTAARVVTALLGAAAVWLVGRAARRLWGEAAAIGAAFFLAFAFLAVEQAHYAKPDTPASFWVALCIWFVAQLATGAGLATASLAGVAAGLAAATKYNAGLCLATPIAVAWLASHGPVRRRLALSAAAIGGAGAAFLVAMPWIVLDPNAVVRDFAIEVRHYSTGQFGGEGGASAPYYLAALWSSGLTPALAAAVVVGVVIAWARDRTRALALAAFPVLYFALLANVRVHLERNLVPVLPGLAPFAGLGLAWAVGRAAGIRPPIARRLALLLIALVAGVWPVLRVALYDVAMQRPGTGLRAARWIDQQAGDATVCADLLQPWLTERVQVRVLGGLGDPPEAYSARGCDLLVVSSAVFGPAERAPDLYPRMSRAYAELFARYRPVVEFRHSEDRLARFALGDEIEIYHPLIRIYRLQDRPERHEPTAGGAS